jgi:DNA mismatch repair protein MutL
MTESGHVVEMFSRIALAHPQIHLTFRSGTKVVHELPPVSGTRERIAVFFGQELADSLLWVEGRLNGMHLWGYVAHPSQSRSTPKGQFLFLSGRYVRDRSLSHALNEAYRGLLMVGRMPVAFLHLDIPPEEVDVNVHPTKIEVRFRDSNRVYSHLLSTLRQTFLKSDLHSRLHPTGDHGATSASASIDAAARVEMPAQPSKVLTMGAGPGTSLGRLDLTGGPNDRQMVAGWFEPSADKAKPRIPDSIGRPPAPPSWAQSLPVEYAAGPGESFDEFSPVATTAEPVNSLPKPPSDSHGSDTIAIKEAIGSLATEASTAIRSVDEFITPSPAALEPALKAIQVHNSYLIAATGDGMIVIDQHALHERILYEELRGRVARGQIESQRLLVPEPVDLTSAEAALLIEQHELLAQLGLEVESFGGDTVLVRSIPAMLPHVNPERLVRDLAEHLRTQPLPPTRDGLLAELLHMVACKAAIKAGQPLTPAEIAALLERRHLVADSHHCPHGRPTALVFTKADLEKQFGRI